MTPNALGVMINAEKMEIWLNLPINRRVIRLNYEKQSSYKILAFVDYSDKSYA